MQLQGRTFFSGNYRYGFNGKENDNEVKGEGNQQDYGMRIYDPRLGRFLSVDPLTKKYPELTTYQFASNSPIAATDVDGAEADWLSWKIAFWIVQAKLGTGNAGETFAKNLNNYSRASNQNHGNFNSNTSIADQVQDNQLKAETLKWQLYSDAAGATESSLMAISSLPGWDVMSDPIKAFHYLSKGDYANATSYGIASIIPGISGLQVKALRTVGTEAVEESVQVFRAVSAEEFVDIVGKRGFDIAPGGVEGKYFSSTFRDAAAEGQKLYGDKAFTIVSTDIPKSQLDQLFTKLPDTDVIVSKTPPLFIPSDKIKALNNYVSEIKVLGSVLPAKK